MPLEKERRFLIEFPLSTDASKLIALAGRVNIIQTYIKNDQDLVERVRHTSMPIFQQRFNHYYHTTKKRISPGIAEEDEKEILDSQYQEKLKLLDPDRLPVVKTRYYIEYNKRMFELDIFANQLNGLSILEIELEDLNEEIDIPPSFNVIKEITGDSKYSNYNLAHKDCDIKSLLN